MNMADDLTLLDDTKHWLGWLGPRPRDAVRHELERILGQQVAGTVVEQMRITAEPHYLTGGRPTEDDPDKVVVTRAALAAPFVALVKAPDGAGGELEGVLSWVAAGLDGEVRKDRVFLDLGDDASTAVDRLSARIYELDAPR
jgi:hypothetical protein